MLKVIFYLIFVFFLIFFSLTFFVSIFNLTDDLKLPSLKEIIHQCFLVLLVIFIFSSLAFGFLHLAKFIF